MPRTPDPLARTSAAAPYQRFPDIGEQTPFRTVIGIIVGVLMFLLAAPVISQVIVAAGWLGVGRPGSLATYTAQAARFQHPVGMLGANLGIAALIPITLILLKGINRAPLSWIWSVTGRPRWGYFAVCVVTAAAVFTGAVLILGQPSGSPTANLALFVVIILGVTSKAAPAGFAPLAIGLALTLIHLISIPVTNTSVNPARSIAAAVFATTGAWSQIWLLIVAPLAGGVIGGAIWRYVLSPGESPGNIGQVK